MTQIIFDISANTTKNDNQYLKRMLDELKAVDTGKHEIVIKGQLFKEAGNNIPMTHEHFDYMYNYSKELGYKCTASVFDKESLDFLLTYDIPFVKISCDNNMDREVPRKFIVIKSTNSESFCKHADLMFCVPEYPARVESYPEWCKVISDHTIGLNLYFRNKPKLWEKHFKLEDSTGLDAGSWAITPGELKEIL